MSDVQVFEVPILALDNMDLARAIVLTSQVGHAMYAVKVNALRVDYGPITEELLFQAGAKRVWIDAKFHDIPNTVVQSVKGARRRGAQIFSVHASGGPDMLKEVRHQNPNTEIYAITVLTSLKNEVVRKLFGKEPLETAILLATWAKEAQLDGVVCSPQEVGPLSKRPELQGLKFVVPGSRSVGKETHDQERADTPANAIRNGATHLVIGRQVTEAADPLAALSEISNEITPALAERRR